MKPGVMSTIASLLSLVVIRASGQEPDTIHSSLRTVDVTSGRIDTVYSVDRHFEAPNWSPDGSYFIVNSAGRLYRLPVRGDMTLSEIPTGFATRVNNDHGISPDGRSLVISHSAQEHITDPAQSWLASSIYIVPVAGSSAPRKITTKAPSFWHGWSPDGKTLAFVGRRDGEWDIYSIPASGGDERRLTTCRGLDDGPDYAPDGAFIYYNSFCSGKMEIWRMRADGSQPQQLTRDTYSNWFPHPSPDGRWVAYLAYLEDQGDAHPFGKQVKLRLLDVRDGTVRDLTPPFFGGQGTLNVPSWSPDSRRIAFVAYAIRSTRESMSALRRDFASSPAPSKAGLVGDWILVANVNTEKFLTDMAGPDYVVMDTAGYRRANSRVPYWEMSIRRSRTGRLTIVSRPDFIAESTVVPAFNRRGDLTFEQEYGGDSPYAYKCRMPDHQSLVCLFDERLPGHGVRFRRVPAATARN